MNIYIASSFDLLDRIKVVEKAIEEKGISIPIKWWEHDYKMINCPDSEWYHLPQVKMVCERNFNGIDNSEVVVIVAPEKNPKKFNGANIELGYAIAKGKTVLCYGVLERSAMYYPISRFSTIEGLLNRLEYPFKSYDTKKLSL